MLSDKLTLIISTCDKYSDLWNIHMELLQKNWPERECSCLLVTDLPSSKTYPKVVICSAGDKLEMPKRIETALNLVNTEYVLLTLDDYFPVKRIFEERIEYAVSVMDTQGLDYLRLWPYPRSKDKIEGLSQFYWVNYESNYQVNLYPGIWRISFLKKTLSNSLSAWMYEVSLTEIAKRERARSALSLNGEFPFLDVIRKGKILHKAKRYLKKNGYELNRETISWMQEIKLNIMYYGKEYLPKPLLRKLKAFMIKHGHEYFSDGI